jgi:hypothetical protein
MPPRELLEARTAIADRQLPRALFLLREAELVAVAQRKLDQLLTVRELAGTLVASSDGRTKAASEKLARRVDDELTAFPADALADAGIDPEKELAVLVPRLRLVAGAPAPSETRTLVDARAALEQGRLASALALLEEARRVAIAQGRLGELLEVHELAQRLAQRSDLRTRTGSERLARKTASDLRAAGQALGLSSSPDTPGRAAISAPRPSDGQTPPPGIQTRIAAGLAWLGLALLAAAVALFLVPKRRSAGLTALIWGLLFAAYLWWGSHQIGLREWKAQLLGILAGLATALYIYLRGASLQRPPADRPGAFLARRVARRRRSAGTGAR